MGDGNKGPPRLPDDDDGLPDDDCGGDEDLPIGEPPEDDGPSLAASAAAVLAGVVAEAIEAEARSRHELARLQVLTAMFDLELDNSASRA